MELRKFSEILVRKNSEEGMIAEVEDILMDENSMAVKDGTSI